jgi:hypothetical protein
MMIRVTPLVLVGMLALPLAAQSVDPRTKPETLVTEGIRLLEAKDYVTFFQIFVPPDDLARVTADTSVQDFASRFGPSRGSVMLPLLKAVSGTGPTLDAEGKTAVFRLKEPLMGKDSLTFVKIGDFWYFRG